MSSRLQAEDMLEDRVNSLKEEVIGYSKEIEWYITALYSINSSNKRFDLKNGPFRVVAVLENDILEIIEQFKTLKRIDTASEEGNNDVRVEVDQEKQVLLENDFKFCHAMVIDMKTLSTIVDNLLSCEMFIKKLEYSNACDSIEDIEQSLAVLVASKNECFTSLKKILTDEFKTLKARILAKARRMMYDCIRFDNGRLVVHKKLKGMIRSEDIVVEEPILLADLWKCIVGMHKADKIIMDILKKLWMNILIPLWKEKV